MKRTFSRRDFSRTAVAGLGAAWLAGSAALAAPARRLKIGHTGITWGYRPENAEQAIKDIAATGYAGFESFGNLAADFQCFFDGKRSLVQPFSERLTFDQLQNQEAFAIGFLQTIDGGDVGMIERCEQLGFTLETGQPLGISGEDVRQNLDGDLSVQVCVFGPVDFAHASCAEFIHNAIVRERCADHRMPFSDRLTHALPERILLIISPIPFSSGSPCTSDRSAGFSSSDQS